MPGVFLCFCLLSAALGAVCPVCFSPLALAAGRRPHRRLPARRPAAETPGRFYLVLPCSGQVCSLTFTARTCRPAAITAIPCFTRRAAPKRGIWPIAWSIITRAPPAGIFSRPPRQTPGKAPVSARPAPPPWRPLLPAARARPFCSTPPPANCWPCAPARALPGATTNFLKPPAHPHPPLHPCLKRKSAALPGGPHILNYLQYRWKTHKIPNGCHQRINCSCYRRHPHSDLTIFLDCFSKYSAIHLHSLLHQTQA